MSPRTQAFALALLILAMAAVYWQSFGNTLFLDQWKAMSASMGSGIYGSRIGMELINRAMISIFGGSALSYHVANFILHAINVVLLFALVAHLTGNPWLGLGAASLTGLSYAASEAIFWPLLYYPLFSIIMILSLFMVSVAIKQWRWIYCALSFVCGIAATSLMEIGLLLPIVMIFGIYPDLSKWRRAFSMAAFAMLGSLIVFLLRTMVTNHPLPYGGGNLMSAGTFIKLVSGWLLMAFTPIYQTFKLLNISTMLSLTAASLVMLPIIATVGIACMSGKNRLKSREIYFAIFVIASITLVILPFASIPEKTALPVIGSRYLYIPYILFILVLFLALRRILAYRFSPKVIGAVCVVFSFLNIIAIRHEARGWAARSAINRSIMNEVEQKIGNGRNPRNIVLVTENGQAWFEPQLPPMQSHSMVDAEFIREMLVFETRGKFVGHVYLGAKPDSVGEALHISLTPDKNTDK